MNKSELVKALAEKAEITQKDAAKALDAVVETVQQALAKGDKVQIIGFGSFEVRDRKERSSARPLDRKSKFLPQKSPLLNPANP